MTEGFIGMTKDRKKLYILMLSGYHVVNSLTIQEHWLSIFLYRPVVNEGKMIINDSQYVTLEPNSE